MMTGAWMAAGYLLGLLIVGILLMLIGQVVTGNWRGVLIDSRKRISLSQFQIVLWTWILLTAFMVIALARIMDPGVTNPLEIAWDERLWALLGISTTSTVGSIAIKTIKQGKEPRDKGLRAIKPRLGLLMTRTQLEEARFSDMFRGEEPVNDELVDVSKVQMFFFTVVVALAYLITLFRIMLAATTPAKIVAMPTLDPGLIFIIGISHVGYLGGKWPDRQPTG